MVCGGQCGIAVDESQVGSHKPIVKEGIVNTQLPSGLCQVDIDGDRRITAHIGDGLERHSVSYWSAAESSWS